MEGRSVETAWRHRAKCWSGLVGSHDSQKVCELARLCCYRGIDVGQLECSGAEISVGERFKIGVKVFSTSGLRSLRGGRYDCPTFPRHVAAKRRRFVAARYKPVIVAKLSTISHLTFYQPKQTSSSTTTFLLPTLQYNAWHFKRCFKFDGLLFDGASPQPPKVCQSQSSVKKKTKG
jgi:hypothetical protein